MRRQARAGRYRPRLIEYGRGRHSVGNSYISPANYYDPLDGDNWRPALQAAFTAGASQNAEAMLSRGTYNCRQLPQPTIYPSTTYHEHALFYVESSIRMRSDRSTGSQIIRRASDGSAMSDADYVDAQGYKWRGGLFVMRSQSTTPNIDPSLYSFTAHDVLFDGGLRYTGQAYEIGDKGLWQANDHNCGNITLTGRSGFIGVGSECVYTSAISGPEASRRLLTIGADCRFGESFLSALNPQGITTNIERCLLYNSFIGVEGWTGEDGGYFKALLRNCQQSSMQAGTYNTNVLNGGYYAYTSPTTPDALGYLDIALEDCGGFSMGSGLRGQVTATDTVPSIGDAATFNNGVRNTDLTITSIADDSAYNPGIFLLGGASGSLATRDVALRLTLQRTAAAAAAGRAHLRGLGIYGSFGTGVSAQIASYPEVAIEPWAAYAAVYDNTPTITVV